MNCKKNVVVITDCKDIAFNEMKWIIKGECKKLGVEDVDVELVAVQEFSILNAAFVARLLGEQCLENTVLSVVINPQKNRSSRIYGRTKGGLVFLGANTGALTWFSNHFGVEDLYEIHDPGFVSFGGKYVHAPNIAKLVAGLPFDTFGKRFPKEDLRRLDIKEGTVLHIDNFGLIKIMGVAPEYDEGQKFKVFINGEYKFETKFSNRMMNNEDGEWILYKGSSLDGLPELGTVRYVDGYKEQGIKIGDIITWEKI